MAAALPLIAISSSQDVAVILSTTRMVEALYGKNMKILGASVLSYTMNSPAGCVTDFWFPSSGAAGGVEWIVCDSTPRIYYAISPTPGKGFNHLKCRVDL